MAIDHRATSNAPTHPVRLAYRQPNTLERLGLFAQKGKCDPPGH